MAQQQSQRLKSRSNLFPEDCFEKREYTDVHEEGELLYRKFHNAASSEATATNVPARVNKSWTLTVLARGKTSGADKILDWMNVVMEGILGKSLSSILFSIYADKNNPSRVLESYKFFFRTSKEVNGNSQPMGLAFSGPHGRPVTITSARAGLKSIVDALRLVESQLPALPAHRFMMCYLFHKPSNSQLFQPVGFRPCQNPIFDPPDNETWHIEKDDLGTMSSGFHTVGLEVNYMACVDYTEVNIPEDMWHMHSMFKGSSGVSPGSPFPQSGNTNRKSITAIDLNQISAGRIGANEKSDHRLEREGHATQTAHAQMEEQFEARFRRALWMAYEKGFPSTQQKFAEMLHDDMTTVAQLVHRMQDEGYLYLYQNRVALVNSAEQTEIRRLEYLNPMALIKYKPVEGNGSDNADSWNRKPWQRQWSRKRKRSDSASASDFIDS
ncbi:DNA binding protein [Pseudocyphellaria aurata]|nr:DNA binding protein [Pseudocyphellaria aurata]